MNNINSAYIHIPFCKHICNYCDFCKMYYYEEWVDKYLEELEKEIKQKYNNDMLKTIYIGGGTPSVLSIEQLNKLFQIIRLLNKDKSSDFTIECNIEDITEEKLQVFKINGVNRISIGVQSFNNRILSFLGRNYDGKEIANKINIVKKYFDNINIDLMYGMNFESLKDLDRDLDDFLKLDITHISIYGLIKENNTVLSINNYQELDDDTFSDMYNLINKVLENNNYIHYEISNYAKAGFESKHNLVYWNNNEYYGFGLGASGFVNNIRYDNTRSISNYLMGKYVLNEEVQSIEDNMENEMILGLRKLNGVSNKVFYNKYNKNIEDVFNVDKLSKKDDIYFIDEDKLFVSNSILVDFLINK